MLEKLKSLTNQLNKSKDGKVVASNFAYLMLLQISSYIFPLLTIPYLARVIGVEGFGKIAFASGVMVWFKTITDWGFNYTATRDVALNRDDPLKVSEIFSNVLWSRMLLMLISLLLLLILIEFIPYFKQNEDILLISFMIIPGSIFFPDWFFQAMERMKFITIFSILSKLVFTLLVFIFITEKTDYILQPLFLSLGFIICGTFAMYIILIQWKIKLIAPNLYQIVVTIRNSTDVFINNLMPNLYNSLTIVVLGFYGGSKANGLLDAGNKFVNICEQFLKVISRVFFPLLSRKINTHNLYAKINMGFSLLASITLFIFAPIIIDLFYTSEFKDSIWILRIMSLSIIFTALISIYGTNYLIVKGYEAKLRKITTYCSLIGFISVFPLIHFYSYLGAAITMTMTRALLGISIMLNAKRIAEIERII